MQNFLSRFGSLVTATLSGFDRIVFRGTIQALVQDGGMSQFLDQAEVRLLDFKPYVVTTSERIKEAVRAEARDQGRPYLYLQSSSASKEDLARRLLAQNPINEGLICVLSAVEPCMSFEYHRSPDPKERGLKLGPRKCLHLYKYWLHPLFGFMNARIQTWFPFNVQICMNGREWLSRQLVAAGHREFKRHDNCFTYLADPEVAQRLMNDQLTTDWPKTLDAVAGSLNSQHEEIFACWPQSYYWSAYQTEWATDLLFKNPRALANIYPALVRHAMLHFASPDVMRFLARKAPGSFTGELETSFKDRAEGVRVKHWCRGNSIKMYDKAGSVLRIETTLANPKDFKVYRPRQDGDESTMEWRPLRKGVADLHRRAEVSQRANNTYLDALSAVNDDTTLANVIDGVSKRTRFNGRQVRAIRFGDRSDVDLLQAISRGEFAISGFRNRDIRALLYPGQGHQPPKDRRLQAAKVSRLLRILRAHGLIKKVQKTHRYTLTAKGQQLTAALFAARSATIKQLVKAA